MGCATRRMNAQSYRKEFLSRPQNKRCVPPLRAEPTALMVGEQKAAFCFSNFIRTNASLKLEPKTIAE